MRFEILHNAYLALTNQKIQFFLFHAVTPWFQNHINTKFSVGGGWGLGWAYREYQGFKLLKSYIDKLKVGAVLNKREILG